jgi:hypothetical protein
MGKKKKKLKVRLPIPEKPNLIFKDKKKYTRKKKHKKGTND